MANIKREPTSERLERMAASHDTAAWGCASELEMARDPTLREHYDRKLQHHRTEALFNREKAAEFRAKGD